MYRSRPSTAFLLLATAVSLAMFLFTSGTFANSPKPPTTLLFVDDQDVLYRSGIRRELHSPVRHPKIPLLAGPEPRNQFGYCSLHRDANTGRYQLWYQLTGAGQVVCYAESTDGIVWDKPALDILSFKGVPDRNVVFTSEDHYGASVVVDAASDQTRRRYKMAYWSLPPSEQKSNPSGDNRGPNGGMYVAFSPDGIHWTKQAGPVLRGTYGRSQDPPLIGEQYPWGQINSVSDVLDASYDPLRERFVVYSKAWIDAPDGKLFWKRAIARTESSDFLTWSVPQLVISPDEFDGREPGAYPGTRRGVQLHGPLSFFGTVYISRSFKSPTSRRMDCSLLNWQSVATASFGAARFETHRFCRSARPARSTRDAFGAMQLRLCSLTKSDFITAPMNTPGGSARVTIRGIQRPRFPKVGWGSQHFP